MAARSLSAFSLASTVFMSTALWMSMTSSWLMASLSLFISAFMVTQSSAMVLTPSERIASFFQTSAYFGFSTSPAMFSFRAATSS